MLSHDKKSGFSSQDLTSNSSSFGANIECSFPKLIIWGSYIHSIQYIAYWVFLTSAVGLLWSWRKRGDEKQDGWGGAVKQQIKTHWDLDSHYILWLEGNICFSGYVVQSTEARGFKTYCMHESIKWYLGKFNIFQIRIDGCWAYKKLNINAVTALCCFSNMPASFILLLYSGVAAGLL